MLRGLWRSGSKTKQPGSRQNLRTFRFQGSSKVCRMLRQGGGWAKAAKMAKGEDFPF